MSGVLIFKGIKPGILPGDLAVTKDETGGEDLKITLSTSYNMIPIWLKIAFDNRKSAKLAKADVDLQWNDVDADQGDLLFAEMQPSIQVFVACATAIDAFYSLLKPHSGISKEEVSKWKSNGTSRSAQTFEVFRRVYKFPANLGSDIRKMLQEIATSRDKAVHPSHDFRPAMSRPDISVGLDWRFCEYRYDSCNTCYENTLRFFLHVHSVGSEIPEINKEVELIISSLIELGLLQKTL